MSRILFLDFDGVCNTMDWVDKCRAARRAPHQWLIAAMVRRVNQIVEATKARVVATTNWRVEYSREALERFLHDAGASFPILSTTPVLCKPRGLEIKAWLEAFEEDVTAFAIVDDLPRDNFDEFGRTHLISTNSNVGLTDVGMRRTIRLLERNDAGFVRPA